MDAGRGLGRAIALALAAAGADLALGLRRADADGGLAGEIEALGRRALPLQMDVTDLGQSYAAIDRAIAEGDFPRYMKGNHDFHFYIYRRSGSPTILHLIEMLWLQYGPSMRFICDRLGTTSIGHDYHRAALDALGRGDRPGFRTAIEADIDQGIGIILDN